LQFSLQATSPETFGYTAVYPCYMIYHFRNLKALYRDRL